MKTIIIEDEKPSVRRLQRLLASFSVKVITVLHSVEESTDWFQNNKHPDLIFLDIQLSDGLSFEIFELLEIKSSIIFTTAYDEYALKAFKLNSIDYLLKPIDEDELEIAIKKYKGLQSNQKITIDFDDIKKLISSPFELDYKNRFTVKVGQHIKILNTDSIECFYSENKGTYIATSEGRNYLLDSSLEKLENELSPKTFFRISRKFYVNIKHIKDIISYSNSRLKIKLNTYNDQELIVSRERVNKFKLWL